MIFRVTGHLWGGNSPVIGEFPSQMPVTRSFDVFFDLRPKKRLIKQSQLRWLETLSRQLWHQGNEYIKYEPAFLSMNRAICPRWHMSMHRTGLWWRNDMEAFSCITGHILGITDGFSPQEPVVRTFDVFFSVSFNKLLNKQ